MRANLYRTLYYVQPQLARAARAERRATRAGAAGSALRGGRALPGSRGAAEPAGYAALLGSTYVLAPVLAFVTWRSLTPLVSGGAAAAVAGALLLLLPPLIHVARGATARGGRALASLLGYTVLGSAGGAALGRTVAILSCSAQDHDGCGLSVLGGLLLGAAVGAVLGYSAHGVRHVLRATGADLGAGADAS